MANYIIGKFKKIIYQNDSNNYVVTLFRVKETNDHLMDEWVNKTINVTGVLPNLKIDANYKLYGSLVKHPKYSWQYNFEGYELLKPTEDEEIIAFLSSSFISGCGKATAQKLVKLYHEQTIDLIKSDYHNILKVKGMTELKAMKIYNSILKYDENDQIVSKLKSYGFSVEDASKILNKHAQDIEPILEGNFYLLRDLFDFNKIDETFTNNFSLDDPLRCKECIIEALNQISFNEGSVYYYEEEIYKAVSVLFNLNISNDLFLSYLEKLVNDGLIIKYGRRYYLSKYYEEENNVASMLYLINKKNPKVIKKTGEYINDMEKKYHLTYNDDQKKAISDALNNNITIISGGPGTGKTTIINAICQIYIEHNRLSNTDIMSNIALLAPTGRASKKLSTSTNLPAYTIHRFLKWHKDDDSFEYNMDNKVCQKLIIIDEMSMIDISLMNSLLSALNDNVQLVLVGDIYQLPSVGPGLVLQDLINSDLFNFDPLNIIYRQSENSYIPFLAKDIKMQNIDDEFMYKRDDYNFIISEEEEIISKISSAVKYAISKGINEDKMQILAPMYKGPNGIDNLNKVLQKLYNPENPSKREIMYGEVVFRENDKVLQLLNDSDKNVFNGDIGKILSITTDANGKVKVRIDFDNHIVSYEKKELKNITHAYAITVHKSQGSEFDHVIMPVCKKYFIMLYNKLLYTGVSRAKKSLTIVGDPRAFTTGIQNNDAINRKTSLKEILLNIYR